MQHSFLFDVCDFHINYAGCGDSAHVFKVIDYITGSLYITTALTYYLVIYLQLKKLGLGTKPLKKIWSRMDTAGSLIPICQAVRAGFSFSSINYLTLASRTANYANGGSGYTNYDIESTLKVSIAFDYLFMLIGGVTTSIFVFSLVDLAGNATLYDKMQVFGRELNIGKIMKIIRLTTMTVLTVITALWCTFGLDDIQSYNKWRNTLYGVYGSAALFISFPIVLTFGNVVMKKLNEKVGEKVERNSVTRPSSVLRTQTLTNQSIRTKVSVGRKSVAKKGAANSKMRALAYLIQSTAYWLYMLLGIMMYCYLIIYTYFSNNSSVLLVAKILCDFYFWSNSSYVLKYFFTRVWNMDDANTVEASRNSDQSHNADKK